MKFKGKHCISHVPQRFARMDKHMDNSCKPGTEYLCSFFMIIYTECGQCLAFFTQENLAYLVKVNVTADFTEISKFTVTVP